MNKIKDSEQMLHFLNDLSKFSGAFGGGTGGDTKQKAEQQKQPPHGEKQDNYQEKSKDGGYKDGESPSAPHEDKKSPQSPTKGIADEFIQNILESYLQKR